MLSRTLNISAFSRVAKALRASFATQNRRIASTEDEEDYYVSAGREKQRDSRPDRDADRKRWMQQEQEIDWRKTSDQNGRYGSGSRGQNWGDDSQTSTSRWGGNTQGQRWGSDSQNNSQGYMSGSGIGGQQGLYGTMGEQQSSMGSMSDQDTSMGSRSGRGSQYSSIGNISSRGGMGGQQGSRWGEDSQTSTGRWGSNSQSQSGQQSSRGGQTQGRSVYGRQTDNDDHRWNDNQESSNQNDSGYGREENGNTPSYGGWGKPTGSSNQSKGTYGWQDSRETRDYRGQKWDQEGDAENNTHKRLNDDGRRNDSYSNQGSRANAWGGDVSSQGNARRAGVSGYGDDLGYDGQSRTTGDWNSNTRDTWGANSSNKGSSGADRWANRFGGNQTGFSGSSATTGTNGTSNSYNKGSLKYSDDESLTNSWRQRVDDSSNTNTNRWQQSSSRGNDESADGNRSGRDGVTGSRKSSYGAGGDQNESATRQDSQSGTRDSLGTKPNKQDTWGSKSGSSLKN